MAAMMRTPGLEQNVGVRVEQTGDDADGQQIGLMFDAETDERLEQAELHQARLSIVPICGYPRESFCKIVA